MLGINIIFAGFALTLNGVSYLTAVDNRAKGVANLLVGVIIAVNAIFQVAQATSYIEFGFSAAMWLFATNYFLIGAHTLLKAENWKVFGLYSLFAATVSFVFAWDTFAGGGPVAMLYMWIMWGILWLQSFLAILVGIKAVDKFTPHILILNGVTSTFIPGLLILLGIIL